MAYCTIGVSKQKGGSVGAAGGHNDRRRKVPNADPGRTHLNRVLVGDERNARERVREIIDEHGGKPRRDSVEAVELLLSASHEFFEGRDGEISQEKVEGFVRQALQFLGDRRNCGLCAKAVLHLDERTPHIHAHMVPITASGRLSATHFLDGRKKMKALHTRYSEHMRELGLERGREGSRATHQRVKQFYASVGKEPRLEIDPDRIPDPQRRQLLTDAGVRQYKLTVLARVLDELREPIRVLQDQAQLTRDEHAHRVEAEKRADEAERAAQEKVAEVGRQASDRFANLQRSAQLLVDENKELRRDRNDLLRQRNELHEQVLEERRQKYEFSALARARRAADRHPDAGGDGEARLLRRAAGAGTCLPERAGACGHAHRGAAGLRLRRAAHLPQLARPGRLHAPRE